MDKPPINIWNNIEKCSVLRLDIVFEGKTIVGIHHSDFNDVVKDIDWVCKKLLQYKSEMAAIYNEKPPNKKSNLFTYIYLLKDNKTGFIKIGRSICPKFREKTLQSEKPDCEIIWISQLTKKSHETSIQKMFAEKRVRGEWFNLDKSDINKIKSIDYGSY